MCAGCFRVGPRGRLVRVWAVCGFIALVCLLRVCLMHYVYMHDIHLFKAACASKSTVSHLDGMSDALRNKACSPCTVRAPDTAGTQCCYQLLPCLKDTGALQVFACE